jgi:D-glycerate 3-kinase
MHEPLSHWELAVNYNIWPTVVAWGQGHRPSAEQRSHLIEWELAHSRQPWQVSPETVGSILESRALLLQSVYPAINAELMALSRDRANSQTDRQLDLWIDWIIPIWRLWLPLAQQLDRQQKALAAPLIQGILGGQGTGKTTLTRMLRLLLQPLGHKAIGLSIDDLYLTHAKRQVLQQQDPRLIWRGPPGTHDIELGIRTLEQFKTALPGTFVSVPRFDKSLFQGQGDRTAPLSQPAPTIVLFEGWLVGAQPIADSAFSIALPDPILTEADRQFARDSNHRLHSYLSLWDFLDSLIVLYPQDYRLSQQWRQQAEHDMKAQGKPGLSDLEIVEFVTYFWKALHPELFITPLTQCSTTALVVEITAQHGLGELYSPAYGHHDLEIVPPSCEA